VSALTGIAGVHYVAARLAHAGYHVAATSRNAPGVDLLIADPASFRGRGVQVKTTVDAIRSRGRGLDKKPHHLEWDVGETSALADAEDLLFAFVDLKQFESLPDVYFVPSPDLTRWFRTHNDGLYSRWRWHPTLEEAAPYKNRYDILGARAVPAMRGPSKP